MEVPGGFGEVRPDALLGLVGNDAAGIAARCPGDFDLGVVVEVSLAGVAHLDNFVVFDGELVPVRTLESLSKGTKTMPESRPWGRRILTTCRWCSVA